MNTHRRISLVLAVAVCFSLLAGSFRLDAARGNELKGVSPIFEIYSDTVRQYYISVAFNPGSGSYLVVWDTVEDSNTTDLWARPVFMDGSLGPVFNIDAIATEKMYVPTVAADQIRLRFLVVYTQVDASNNKTIFARTVTFNGSQINPPIPIMTTSTAGLINFSSVVYNPTRDEYLLVYDDNSDPACNNSKMYAVHINAETLALSTPVEIGACTSDEYNYRGVVALNPVTGQYQLAYVFVDTANTTASLITRWLSADLTQLGMPVEIDNDSYSQWVTLSGGKGTFLSIFIGLDAGKHMQIYGQFIGIDGGLLGEPFQIPVTMNNPDSVWFPQVAFSGSLGYLVFWSFKPTDDTGDGFNAYYRLIPERPILPTTPEFVLAGGPGDQGYLAGSCVPGMQCLMAFLDDQSGDDDIFGRIFFISHQLLPLVAK